LIRNSFHEVKKLGLNSLKIPLTTFVLLKAIKRFRPMMLVNLAKSFGGALYLYLTSKAQKCKRIEMPSKTNVKFKIQHKLQLILTQLLQLAESFQTLFALIKVVTSVSMA